MSIEKPEAHFPGGEPPTELEISDIWLGDGAVAKAGDKVQVHYVGVAYSTGEEFDTSWSRGARCSSGWALGRSSRAGIGACGACESGAAVS
jgi:peptidylprolyl isomerase